MWIRLVGDGSKKNPRSDRVREPPVPAPIEEFQPYVEALCRSVRLVARVGGTSSGSHVTNDGRAGEASE